MHKIRTMVNVKITIALGLIAILILAAPIATAQEVPPHVVISEVQIATNEFVELYNPTNSDINMAGWHWCYFSSGRNWNNSYRDKTFPSGAIIPAHGFYLIATTSGEFSAADWNLEYSTHLLSDTAGSVGIFPWDPDTKTAEEAKAGRIDTVGWGSVTHVYETATVTTPSLGESIDRRSLDDDYAPCQDTDDNSIDFAVQDTPTPKNSASPEMAPAPVELFDVAGEFKGGFVNIQDAVDAASDGYTILVDEGTYTENLDVDKPLTIRSEHGAAVTTVQALDSNDPVIYVTADHVNITGFKVNGTTNTGIYLLNSNYCNISDNSASNINIGIRLYQSSYNTIFNNNVSGNSWIKICGLMLVQSGYNTITNNNLSNNNQNGIRLSSSDENFIYNNYFNNTNNADDDGNNIWNITKTDGTNIIGGPYLGGNYWSDYAGDDTKDGDGLGDTLTPYNSNGNIDNGGDGHPLVRVGAPSLSIVKSGEPDHMHPGGTIDYTVIVSNTEATATNVIVTETYDANVTFESAVPAPSPDNNTWIFPTVIVNESKWINISVTVNPATPSGTIVQNRVDVTCDQGVTANATVETVVGCVESLLGLACFEPDQGTIEDLKAVDASTPPPEGYKFPYGFFSFNITGLPAGKKVNVTITLPCNAPEGIKYWVYNGFDWIDIPVVGGDDYDKNITITLLDGGDEDYDHEANGQIVVYLSGPGGKPPEIIGFAPKNTTIYDSAGACRTFNVTVNQTVNIIWSLDDDPQQSNESVREASFDFCRPVEGEFKITASAKNIYNPSAGDKQSWTWIINETNIAVTKVSNVTEAKPSTNVSYIITISNTGNSTLDRILVEDQLREGLIYSSADPAPNATEHGTIPGDIDVTNLTWYFNESLAVSQSKTIKLNATIAENATGVLRNRVDVTGWPETGDNVSARAITDVRLIKLVIEKTCSSTASLGKTLTYTITYSNNGGTNLTNVVIIEDYPDALTFDSADPAPDCGTNNKWTLGTLKPGESGTITIKMKVPASMSDLYYSESGNVAGKGIVIISKDLSTVQEPYELENVVTISGTYEGTDVSATASAMTTVSVPGSSLELTEHGSGTYESEEELSLSLEDGRIYFDKDTKAEYSPTTFNCSDGFVMEVPSKWSQDICSKNYAKKTAIHKSITEATYIDDNTRINTYNNVYTMDFDSSFDGYLHVDKWTTSKPKEPKVAATSEHYIGEFVITDWDESADKCVVEGVGYVIVDKELATGRLLLMEHGSGTYSSEEDSSSSRIHKTTHAVYEPTQFNFSDSFVVNFSSKWMQDVCARNKKGTTALHKKIRDATFIDDDSQAKSSPSLQFESFFRGATHVGSRSSGSMASEDYIGEFYISWGAATDCTYIFDWDDVPGPDNDKLIRHLSEDKFGMPWVTDADVEITKPYNDTIDITDPEANHSAAIILNTTTNETAKLEVAGGGNFTFVVQKHGDTLRVYDCELARKPEEVMGEGFVMIDEAIIFKDGEIVATEHGSGIYYSHEDFGKKTLDKSTYGEYKPYYFSFADSFAVNLSSKWVQDICVLDKAEGTAMHKRISNAALMKDDTIVTKSSMDLNSSFNGSMHIGARTGDIRISEDYIGEFNVTQVTEIVKEKPSKSNSETSDWLSCPSPIALTTSSGGWLSCPYPMDLSSTPATSKGLHSHWPWYCPSHWNWAPP